KANSMASSQDGQQKSKATRGAVFGGQAALFGGQCLDMSMLALDQDSLERRSLARNEVLFRQGDKVTAFISLKKGGCGWNGAPSTADCCSSAPHPRARSSSQRRSFPIPSIATPWRRSPHGCASIPRPWC